MALWATSSAAPLRSRSVTKALFLDRDGVVNVDTGYVHRVEDFVLVDGVLDFCRTAVAKGYLLIVVTNQSGIARGLFTEDDFADVTAHMRRLFDEAGCPLTDVFHCPDLEGPDRKPAPGMFLKARDKWEIDLAASVSVGDSPRDLAAGEAAGVGRNFRFAGSFKALEGEL